MGVKELVRKIRYKKGCMKVNQVIDKNKKPTMKRNTVAKKRERSVSRLQSEFEELGVTHLEVDNPDTTSTELAAPAEASEEDEGGGGNPRHLSEAQVSVRNQRREPGRQ